MRWIGFISLFLLLVAAPMVPASAASAAASTKAKGIDWSPCPEDSWMQCGTVSVPVDWDHPAGDRIDLAVARLPAAEPRERIGALFLLPGGPGGSGIDFLSIAGDYFGPEFLRRFDVIGFDARGIGRSQPVLCPDDPAPPSEFPKNAGEYQRLVKYHQNNAEECRRLTGPVFDHVDTRSVAHDTDAVRAALDERQISLIGQSYGTLLGQQYAEEYPGRIRALVLDSNMDHSVTDVRRYLISGSEAVEQGYHQFTDWCARSTRCALHGKDPLKVLDALFAKADRGELKDPAGTVITPDDLSETIREAMYGPNGWPSFATYLLRLRHQDRLAVPNWYPNAYMAILCSDFRYPVRNFDHLQNLMAASRRAAPHTRVNVLSWTDITGCQGYRPKADNTQRPYRIKDVPPILLTNSRYDPATPYSWATNVARQIPGSVLLTYDGVGHVNYGDNPCSTAAIDRYLLTLRTPPPGTHCPAVPIPSGDNPLVPNKKTPQLLR